MRGSPFHPHVPEVHMGQLHLRTEDTPDREKCSIRALIFIVQSGLKAQSQKDSERLVLGTHGSKIQTPRTAVKKGITSRYLITSASLDCCSTVLHIYSETYMCSC